MKLFEIGDGLKSIKVFSNYYSAWENDNTVLLYDPEKEFVEIRISLVSVEPKDSSDVEPIYRKVISSAKERGQEAEIVNGKSYYTYTEDSKSDGEDITLFFFEIGYKCHYIIISVTVSSEYAQNNEEEVEDVLSEMIQFILSIEEISLETTTIFEPKYTDFKNINERIAEILNIREEDIDTYHEKDKTIAHIQKIINEKKYKANQTYELQSLGIVLGDYIQYKDNNYHWAIARDEYGRDACLQYKNFALTVFPLTMISKRIEDGQSVVVSELISGLFDKMDELSKSGDFSLLDYNS